MPQGEEFPGWPRLEWASKNGARRRHGADRTAQAGEAVIALADTVQEHWLHPAQVAASALAPLVDERFRRHCRVARAVDGRVVIQVDEPGLVAEMRGRWLGVVRKGMEAVDRRLSTGMIVFEVGRSGVEVALV